ncbi:hypothetical protein P3T18_001206 [Paraburkholderia sp. GAS199]|uniref:hypothetical protein n=1 Tax=Paraburkholderia sp. GAS199 TaxID=3035126 RepID=UPI003D1F7322
MASQRKSTRQPIDSARSIYRLYIARGSSHISSAMSIASQRAAIDEVIRKFRQRHTGGDLRGILQLLAEDLEKRGKATAATTVRDFVHVARPQ